MEEKTVYAPRLFARLIDLLFVVLTVVLIEEIIPVIDMNLLLCFWLYNTVAILFNGKTLGKFTFSISIKTRSTGVKRIGQLIIRECLFLLLFPLLFFNLLAISSIALHDRIMQSTVRRDDI